MAGGKETPRQRMISLMYLVFIAMMAMNVDREVLRSFEGVNQSLELSTRLAHENNKTFYEQIEAKKDQDDGYKKISVAANLLKDEANKVITSIEDLKKEITNVTEYHSPEGEGETNYNSLQNIDATNKIMFVAENKPTEKLKKMYDLLKQYKAYLLKGNTDKKAISRINDVFNFTDVKKPWLMNQFYGQPMIATLTNLTKLESNIRTEEGYRVRDLLSNKLQDEIELKAFVPIVSAPKFVRAGDHFDVIIGFGAYDNSLRGNITLNGRTVPLVDGKGSVSMVASGKGPQTLQGSITYETPNGPKTEKFNESYEVVAETLSEVPTGATVVADNMNVVYRGVDNPMSGSVTGVDASTITMSASSGNLTRSGKGWIYRPGAGKTTDFTISGKTSTGKIVSAKVTYRIKNVPKAQGQIRNQNVLSIPASSLVNQSVGAAIPDFEFPVNFTVTGFKVKVPGQATVVVTGNSLRGASGALSRVRAGDQVLIFDISATATGVTQQNISPIVINVQ